MTREEAIWHANHVFNLVIERCINAQNLKDAREFDEAKQIVIETLQHEQERREDIYECPNCLGEVHINYIYCPFCGIKVESDEQ